VSLQQIDGADFLKKVDLGARTEPELRRYLRPDSEIARVKEESVLGDTRYNADGTLDFLKWSRPQNDGPASRALVALRFLEADALIAAIQKETTELIHLDLNYTAKHVCESCFDIWEEEFGQHYYTCLLQYAALQRGALWAISRGEETFAATIGAAADRAREVLDSFWSSDKRFYLSRIMPEGQDTTKELDFSVILGILRAGLPEGPHSITDERVAQTMYRLEKLFAAEYAVNRGAAAALAFGRYSGDRYFSGGAYFVCTFGAAEFYYKLAMAKSDGCLIDRGDTILSFARGSIPSSGEVSEQFDQATREQTSARSLTWSYAAFITAWSARKDALQRLRPRHGATS
jgi:glucoamylase